MRLTLKGKVSLLAAIGLLVLGLVLRAPVAVGVSAFLFAAIAVAVNSVRDISVSGSRSISRDRVGEQEPVRVTIELVNEGSGTHHLEIREALPRQARLMEGTNHAHVAVPAKASKTHEFKIAIATIGDYEIGPLTARVSDAFGLVFDERQLASETHVLVKPRVEKLKTVPVRSRLPRTNLGSHITRRSGEGFEFYAIRPYQPGDTPRMINWKASARTDEMLVNQRSHESYADITFLVDARGVTEVGVERYTPYAQGARAVASIASYLLKQRDVLRVHLYTDRVRTIQPKTPGNFLRDLREELSIADPQGKLPLGEVVDEVRPGLLPKSPVVIVSSLEEDDTSIPAIKRLLAGEHQVLVVSPRPRLDGATDQALEQLADRKRDRVIRQIRAHGAAVLDWEAGKPLNTSVMEALR